MREAEAQVKHLLGQQQPKEKESGLRTEKMKGDQRKM